MTVPGVVTMVVAAVLALTHASADLCNDPNTVFATADVGDPTTGNNVTARITFSSQANPRCTNITVTVTVSGLPEGKHGIHIHTGNNMSLPGGCNNTGPHYNPLSQVNLSLHLALPLHIILIFHLRFSF